MNDNKNIISPKAGIEEVLNRWADKIYPSKEEFLKELSLRKLVIYHGVDPTAPDLHLGHSTNYLLLRKFQELGHKIILLIGDFTAQIGDPTGKASTRKPLTKEQILKNWGTYQIQAGKILDFKSKKNPAVVKFNSRWLEKLDAKDIIKLMANFTHGQMIKRNMFQERLKKGQEIFLPEFLYPLLQGYDSVALDVDVEVGGTDQTFNMLVGRDLLKIYKNKEKFVITTPLLENPKTGKKLMSKSEGGYVSLNDSTKEMFGKVMALPDEAIIPCFKLCTEVSLKEIEIWVEKMKIGNINPRDLKVFLAREIVKIYHGDKKALEAEKEFEKVFRQKEIPSEIPTIKIEKIGIIDTCTDVVVGAGFTKSRSEAKRLIGQGAVEIDGKIQTDWRVRPVIKKGTIVKVGKRKFIKLG